MDRRERYFASIAHQIPLYQIDGGIYRGSIGRRVSPNRPVYDTQTNKQPQEAIQEEPSKETDVEAIANRTAELLLARLPMVHPNGIMNQSSINQSQAPGFVPVEMPKIFVAPTFGTVEHKISVGSQITDSDTDSKLDEIEKILGAR